MIGNLNISVVPNMDTPESSSLLPGYDSKQTRNENIVISYRIVAWMQRSEIRDEQAGDLQ